jgi:anti-sigma B factor antagonist
MSVCVRRRADATRGLHAGTPVRWRGMELVSQGALDAPGVTVRGEVDLEAVAALEAALEEGIRESAGAFVIDLSDVGCIDSSGLQVLLRARALLGREDRALAVVCPFGRVRRVFELSGVSELFALYPSREAAAAALVPAD